MTRKPEEGHVPIRAGMALQFRVHSLDIVTDPYIRGLGSVGGDGLPDLIIELSRDSQFPVKRFGMPRFVVRGQPASLITASLDESPFHGCFLTVIATRLFDVPSGVAAPFFGSPQLHVETIDALIGADLASMLRPKVLLAASTCAVKLAPAVVEPWFEFKVFWASATQYTARYVGNIVEALDVELADGSRLNALTESAILASTDDQKGFYLAGNWYMRGRSEVAGSTERFLGLVQCLEALTSYAPQEPSPEMRAKFESLATLVGNAADGEKTQLIEFLKNVKQRIARPTLSERFQRLLKLLDLANPEELAKQFDAMNRIRNDLLHAQITEIPGSFRGYDVDRTLVDLATVVLSATADMLVAQAMGKGFVVEIIPLAQTHSADT